MFVPLEDRGNKSNRTPAVVCLNKEDEIFCSMTRSNEGKKINLAPSTLSRQDKFKNGSVMHSGFEYVPDIS